MEESKDKINKKEFKRIKLIHVDSVYDEDKDKQWTLTSCE